MSHRSIAIDGPSGAGKSTLAKMLAKELNYLYVDTGAIYRTVGLAAMERGVSPEDEGAVAALLPGLDIRMGYGEDGLQRMFLNGVDVTDAIRQNQISEWASKVASLPAVRAFLLDMQRKLAREHDVIMDGRDIGTVVLPQADLKLYLTADASARADRRYAELVDRGQTVDRAQILRDVMERDARDMNRAVSPLKQAEDAVVVDTTRLDLDESFRAMLSVIRENLKL
jgi:cytidylate kinase